MEAEGGPDVIGYRETFRLGTKDLSVADAEGRTIQGVTWEEYEGRVDEASARSIQLAAQMGQTHDIVVLAAPDVPANDRQVVEVTTPERLAGRYKIEAIRTTRRGLRLLCTRDTVKEG